MTHRVPTKGKDGAPAPLPMEVVLGRDGLEAYTPYFVHCGHHTFETHVRRTNEEVEAILLAVDRAYEDDAGYAMPLHDRTRLWKTIMYAWHRNITGNKRFIEKHELEKIFLPKRDFRMMDSEIKLTNIDPDRQRQIVRKRVVTSNAASGTGDKSGGPKEDRREQQFEVYKRKDDICYILEDLHRCVTEWQRMNPRKMLKEDPREEVMKMRVQRAMELFDAMLHERKALRTQKMRVTHALLVTRLSFLSLAMLMFVIAYTKYWNSPGNAGLSRSVQLSFFISARQIVSGTSFIIAACVAYIVAQRRKADPMIRQLHGMVISCERFMEEIADFRVETEDIRMESKFDNSNTMAARLEQVRTRKAAVKVRRRRRRRRKDEDGAPPDALSAWGATPDMLADGPNWEAMIVGIEKSFQRLPNIDMPDDYKRPGDGRMSLQAKHAQLRDRGLDVEYRHVRVPAPPPMPPPGGAQGALESGGILPPLQLCPPVPIPTLPEDRPLNNAESTLLPPLPPVGPTHNETQVDLTLGSMGLTPPAPPEPGWAGDPAGLRSAGGASRPPEPGLAGDPTELRDAGNSSSGLLPPTGLRETGEAHLSMREGPLSPPETFPQRPPAKPPAPSTFLPEDESNFEPSASGLLGAMQASFSVGASLPDHLQGPIAPGSSSIPGTGEFTAGLSATDPAAPAAPLGFATAAGSTISGIAADGGNGRGEEGDWSSIGPDANFDSVDESGVPGLSEAELSSDAAHELSTDAAHHLSSDAAHHLSSNDAHHLSSDVPQSEQAFGMESDVGPRDDAATITGAEGDGQEAQLFGVLVLNNVGGEVTGEAFHSEEEALGRFEELEGGEHAAALFGPECAKLQWWYGIKGRPMSDYRMCAEEMKLWWEDYLQARLMSDYSKMSENHRRHEQAKVNVDQRLANEAAAEEQARIDNQQRLADEIAANRSKQPQLPETPPADGASHMAAVPLPGTPRADDGGDSDGGPAGRDGAEDAGVAPG